MSIVRRFKVRVHLDGKDTALVTIKPTISGEDAVIGVRVPHSKREYTLLLSEVALFVAAKDAKRAAAQQGTVVPQARKWTRAEAAAERRRNTLFEDEK